VFNADDDIFHFSDNFVDQDEERLEISFFSCVAEDLNGTIWVGTNNGPIVFYNPSAITEPNGTLNSCSRIKVPRNDGTDLADYLLEGVVINTIAVDGANRKWIGSKDDGVFLVNPAGDAVISARSNHLGPDDQDVIEKGKIMIKSIMEKTRQAACRQWIALQQQLRDQQGQGTTEYAILVGVLVVIAIIAIVAFRSKLEELWTTITENVNSL